MPRSAARNACRARQLGKLPTPCAWQLPRVLDADLTWDVPASACGVLETLAHGGAVVFWRTRSPRNVTATHHASGAAHFIILHVPDECHRVHFRRCYPYQRSTCPSPVRTVNACFLQDIMVPSAALAASRLWESMAVRTAAGEYGFNTMAGVAEISCRSPPIYRANLKGFRSLSQAQQTITRLFAELGVHAPGLGHTQLNLLILDASTGVPMDIAMGGAVAASVRTLVPAARIQYEEPDFNCHMLVTLPSLAAVPGAPPSLASFKVDISITRLGKFIFRISTRRECIRGLRFTTALEAEIEATCLACFMQLAHVPPDSVAATCGDTPLSLAPACSGAFTESQ